MATMPTTARAVAAATFMLFAALRPDAALSASAAEIEIKTDATLKQFVETVEGAQVFLDNAKGVLVMPSIFQAGFVIGGQYGEGALRIDGQTVDYYNTVGGSFGFQIGAQTRAVIMVFMEQSALDQFRSSYGWEVGVDGSVALVELGAAASLSTTSVRDPIVAFIFDNKGLMYNLTLEGSKFTKLNKTGKPTTTATPAAAPAAPAPATAETTVEPAPEDDEEAIILRRP